MPHKRDPIVKTRYGGAKDGSRAIAVGDPAAQRDKDREAQQIGGDSKIEMKKVLVHRLCDLRQSRCNDRRIEIFHEECRGDDQRNSKLLRREKRHEH